MPFQIISDYGFLYLPEQRETDARFCYLLSSRKWDSIILLHIIVMPYYPSFASFLFFLLIHSEKSPARPMLFYSTNYWQQFWVQFVV